MKKVLIIYSHFSPAFKAGGPVQSLVNLVQELKDDFAFFVVCSAYEMGERSPLQGIIPGTWNDYAQNVKVYYSDNSVSKSIRLAFQEVDPDVVYINGLFLPFYNTFPLWLAKRQHRMVVLAPRGMLQQGALAVKPLKKKIFLTLFKIVRLHKNVTWHATDKQESEDIKRIFGATSKVKIAANVPKALKKSVTPITKSTGKLRLVYLSLITQKKNLHLVLEALRLLESPIQFDIYGPVKDEEYWLRCQRLFSGQKHAIAYQGVINPNDVQDTLAKYHALILPTKGENFGHAIFEALSVGTPPIISHFTPWGKLQDANAGTTVESEDVQEWAEAIRKFVQYDQQEFDAISKNAHRIATAYIDQNDFKAGYFELFR